MQTKRDRKAWLAGGSARCTPLPQKNGIPRRLVLLGAPGVGVALGVTGTTVGKGIRVGVPRIPRASPACCMLHANIASPRAVIHAAVLMAAFRAVNLACLDIRM